MMFPGDRPDTWLDQGAGRVETPAKRDQMRFNWNRCLSVALILGLFSAGCGFQSARPQSSISGQVTKSSKPVTGAVIVFFGENGESFGATLEPSGSYEVAQCPPGKYQVAIQPVIPSPEELEKGAKVPEADFHARYRTPQTSGLTATINPGSNVASFEL
ncbi:carboxypeptidase-like regulatory domain-containing protein [Planctomicrobium sp. SH661]|uniref:carboxypeptidase-like regulatory domain-containing protein n=1 Tax=Planctomicrobium sp. SH661 TaxID=3448124 RepID=UPI003F5C6D9C